MSKPKCLMQREKRTLVKRRTSMMSGTTYCIFTFCLSGAKSSAKSFDGVPYTDDDPAKDFLRFNDFIRPLGYRCDLIARCKYAVHSSSPRP